MNKETMEDVGGGSRWNVKSLSFLFLSGLVLASIQKELSYMGGYLSSTTTGSSTSISTSKRSTKEILSQAQRRTRRKLASTSSSSSATSTTTSSLDVYTVQLMKETLLSLLDQVEEETGSTTMVSVGDVRDTLDQVMEHMEIEASATSSSSTSGKTLQSTSTGTSSIATSTSMPTPQATRADGLNIAVYMTTHVSHQHLEYLIKCWPAAMARLDIFQNVDLIVYTSSYDHDLVFQSLGFRNVIFHRYKEVINPLVDESKLSNDKNMQKQQGALRAMVDPFLVDPSSPDLETTPRNWFSDYDWIVRLNPDVMIRRDAWLLQQLRTPDVKGVFVRWDTEGSGLYLHTDFYAFRPSAIDYKAMMAEYKRQRTTKFHAELHFTSGFRHLFNQQPPALAFLPNVYKTRPTGIGHVGGKDCDVIHAHKLIDHCPNYWEARDNQTLLY
ncbi:expressed unknown protein [Seminavis robusta]|uniref:Uncharacterized protein n=1 Tax=Seminavis robusta TaxID=568900 RepID=A0A9N8HTE8_9STRA|nr:expressed unknown protein [Seminavis robusta]|eukprot:Sro1867_g302550.1 n/a (441) ;mRNA; r:2589-3911